jgi:Flp pilus assembly protein TadB
MSAHVLTVVPVVMLAVLLAADGDVRVAVAGRTGGACVVSGLLLNAVGWSWMRRIIGGFR